MTELPKKSEMNEYNIKEYNNAFEMIRNFSDIVNSGDDAMIAGMLDGFIKQHRTLQQGMVRAFVKMLTEWNKTIEKEGESYYVDLRNQDAAEFARDIAKDAPGFRLI